MNYWLMKSEGDSYGIHHLQKDKTTAWEGVRNYQARNFMNDMEVGDMILFYHSITQPIGIYGLAKVSKKSHPDETQFDPKSKYYDEKSTRENPRWWCVDISFVEKFKKPITLEEIKRDQILSNMRVVQKGSRLSVHLVTKQHFDLIVQRSRE